MRTARESYTKYFNNKYFRSGSLGDKGLFMQEVQGLKHFIAATSYVIKNAPHHGVASSPFEYPYSSGNAYFRKELGKNREGEIYLTRDQIKAVLPRRASFNPEWKMGIDGVFLPETVLDVKIVEQAFGTVQAFNYYMGRKSGEDWQKEQEEENGSMPFSLENVEALWLGHNSVPVAELLRNEKARFVNGSITDLELCKIIDEQLVPSYDRKSVYHLSKQEKTEISNLLYKEYHAGVKQIKRCLVI